MILTYSIKHRKDYSSQLLKAQLVADYAVENKADKKVLTSKFVKNLGLPSAISNQILRKYSSKTIKCAKNVNLIVPNQAIKYDFDKQLVTITPLKTSFRWFCGRDFKKINQIEITSTKYFVCVSFDDEPEKKLLTNVLGIDLNCGVGRSIAVCSDLCNNKLLTFGKEGPNIKKRFLKLRKKLQKEKNFEVLKRINNKEKRVMRDLDHKISKQIVTYAKENNATIVFEDLKGIRNKTGNGSGKAVNRIINSWSFYRLQTYVIYKAKLYGIPVEFIKPQYTSQHCNYCKTLGSRKGIGFVCKSKACKKYNKSQNSDINASYNIGNRYLKKI